MNKDFRILLVDDDEFVRQLIGEDLAELGYGVESARDGQEAWEKLEGGRDQYDLILLDKNMPRMDGIALLKCIKTDPHLAELPVVMLTAADQPQDKVDGLAAGAYYYLIKPAPTALLASVISNALAEYEKKCELRDLVSQQKNNLHLLNFAKFSFQTLDDAKHLALLLADISMDPGRTVSGYSELLINAVEHGNLGITYAEKGALLAQGCWAQEIQRRLALPEFSKRRVDVEVVKSATMVEVTITDQGDGFDWQKYLEFDPERVFDLHGRGIAMSKCLSFDTLEYCGNGNTVATTVALRDPGA